jgi:hypothetical protein
MVGARNECIINSLTGTENGRLSIQPDFRPRNESRQESMLCNKTQCRKSAIYSILMGLRRFRREGRALIVVLNWPLFSVNMLSGLESGMPVLPEAGKPPVLAKNAFSDAPQVPCNVFFNGG